MSEVKLLKMPFREHVICQIVAETADTVTIKNPMMLVMMGMNQTRGANAAPEIGIAPWLEFSDQKQVTLDKRHILCIIDPMPEIKNEYNAAFGSGLVTPSSKLIVPGH